MQAAWVIVHRVSNPDEVIAQPSEDNMRGQIKRYIIYNTRTKATTFKEWREPPLFLGHFDNVEAAIKHVMRKL